MVRTKELFLRDLLHVRCKINAVFCNLGFFPCVFQEVLGPLLDNNQVFLKQFIVEIRQLRLLSMTWPFDSETTFTVIYGTGSICSH